jgi:hypothetical protein
MLEMCSKCGKVRICYNGRCTCPNMLLTLTSPNPCLPPQTQLTLTLQGCVASFQLRAYHAAVAAVEAMLETPAVATCCAAKPLHCH